MSSAMPQNGPPAPTRGKSDDSKGGWLVVIIVVALLALVGGIWVAAYFGAGDKVAKGTEVAGVEIGGKTQSEAADILADELGKRAERTVTVTADGESVDLVPSDSGFTVDYVASVADAGGRKSWSPSRLWDYYSGSGQDLDPVVEVDQETADEALQPLLDQIEKQPTDGVVAFKRGRVDESAPKDGVGIDLTAAREAISEATVAEDAEEVSLEPQAVEPEITQADVDTAVQEIANPAMSGPVGLQFGDETVTLRPREYSRVLSMKPDDGALALDVDADGLEKLLEGKVSKADKPVDATVRLVNGKPKIIKAKPGVTFKPEDVESVFTDLVTAPSGEREGKVKSTVQEADFSTEDARKLGIKRKVSSFTTYFPYAEYRNVNIGRAGELINGTVLKPGDTFSLNDIVGERTAENGFTTGTIISDGIFKEDLGGGVSQMATTTFNAAFFAGLKDIEHKPHSFYIDRYPVGREATVAWGSVDLRFENDTPYGVLVQVNVKPSSYSSQGEATVTMWSTKYWDITTKTSDRYNFTSPQTRTLTTPDCVPNSGYGGFDVDVWRYFTKHGEDKVEKTEKLNTTYIPSDTVVCKEPEPEKPDKPGDGGGNGGGN